MQKIPVYFYPTNILFVDDNKRCLNNACLDLSESIAYNLFNDSEQAYSYLKNKYKINSIIDKISEKDHDNNYHLNHNFTSTLNISNISLEIYNEKRFNDISVLVLDYDMPKMDGIQLAKNVKELGLPVKILLITAVVDEKIAVAAFNEGLIHSFLIKTDVNFVENLNKNILKLQSSYFTETSSEIYKRLPEETKKILASNSFIEEFDNIINSNSIVEYYLHNSSGTFMLLDCHANISWFLVNSSEELDEYYDIARDTKASATVLDYIKDGKMIPFFANKEQLSRVSGFSWENHMFNAKRFNNILPTVYYSFISGVFLEPKSKVDILSFNEYMNRIWPSI